jgi:hypothetical protein
MPDGEPMFEQVMRSLAEMVGRPDAYAPPLAGSGQQRSTS